MCLIVVVIMKPNVPSPLVFLKNLVKAPSVIVEAYGYPNAPTRTCLGEF
jgi:hypothetical protein